MIHADWSAGVFVVEWLANTKGSLPEDLVSDSIFPQVYAWITRFNDAVKAAKATAPEVTKLKGSEAAEQILSSGFAEPEGEVNSADTQSLRKGDHVEVFPIDTGFAHHEKGVLIGLTGDEIVVSLENGLRLHTPRIGFRVRNIGSKI